MTAADRNPLAMTTAKHQSTQHDAKTLRALFTQGAITSKAEICSSVRIAMEECFHPDARYKWIANGCDGIRAPVSSCDAYGTLIPAKSASLVGVRSDASMTNCLHNANV
ncbi:hypothetical protein [Sphingomonas sp. S17]|uniref:hypothetical protein n=1 Tax=Sphingomonas sp. S17 TaxID=1007104 RepID=UPI00111298A2|nr:hypothetical protein [Sphingomonas sp. S17]